MIVSRINFSLLFMILPGVVCYEFVCPDRSQLRIYSKAACSNPLEFTCLKDALVFTHDKYRTSCYQSRPVAVGYKYVFRPWYDREKCDSDRYQPFIFYRNRQSDCFYLKSSCNEEGQLTYTHGSTTSDVQCKCDEKNGYTFVTEPKNKISCTPSEEDCSCYRIPNKNIYDNDDAVGGSMTAKLNLGIDRFDETKYNIKGREPYSRYCATLVTITVHFMIFIYWLFRWQMKRIEKLGRCLIKKFRNCPPKDINVEEQITETTDINTEIEQIQTWDPFEKLVLKEYLFKLTPKEAIKFATKLKTKCVIDKMEYKIIKSSYQSERNEYLRLITIENIIGKCRHLGEVVKVLFKSGTDGPIWAKDLYNIYQARQVQMPCVVHRAPVGHRQRIQHDFLKYKRLVQSLQIENPIDYISGMADSVLILMSNLPNNYQTKVCDQYLVFVALAFDSLANKTNNIDIDNPKFAKSKTVLSNTSCPVLSRCMLYGRQAVALSFLNDKKTGDDVVTKALTEERSVEPCIETVDLYYKIVLYQRAWYEKDQQEITKKINGLCNMALVILASEQDDDVRLFWSRRFIVRLLYCYLGLGMRGRFIPGFVSPEHILKESIYLISRYDSDDAEVRIQMLFCIAKARLFQLTGNKTEALQCISTAADIGLKGGFQAELSAIKDSKQQIQML